MKTMQKLLILLAVCLAACLMLVGCDDDGLEIVFVVDDTEYHKVETDGTSEITLPDAPVKDGYDFLGWYLEEEKIDEKTFIDFSSSGTVTVTAKFTLHEHTEKTVIGYAPTCTEDGLTDGVKCSICGEVITAGKPIKAMGHKKAKGYCTVCTARIPSVGLSLERKDDGYCVTGIGTCTDTEIIIPEMHGGIAVVGIADDAFRGSSTTSYSFTLIDIPNSVTHIGRHAFYLCEQLVEVRLSEKLTSLGEYAFAECASLVSISITSPLTEIPSALFYGCKNLKKATFAVTTGWSHYDSAQDSSSNGTMRLPTKVGSTTVPNYSVLNELYVHEYWKHT